MILDVGCGSRMFGDIGVDLGYKVLASDSGSYTKANVFASAEYLPFKTEAFEVVHFLGLLHHLHDPLRAWNEMVRVSKDVIIGEEPSIFNYKAYLDPFHIYKGFRKSFLLKVCRNGVKHLRCHYLLLPFPVPIVNIQIIALKRHNG